MRHEKVITRPDGRKIKIAVTFWFDSVKGACYDLFIMVCEPRKRTFLCVVDTDSHSFKSVPFGGKEREKYKLEKYLQFVTLIEIQTAKEELWQLLKPTS